MMDNHNTSFTATIPSDIRSGKYILRHEIVALHFSIENKVPGFEFLPVGAQFYPHCFSIEVVGGGSVVPEGVRFPGGYREEEEGMRFDVRNGKDGRGYKPLGPGVYANKGGAVVLEERERVVLSPTGQGEEADKAYWEAQKVFLERQGAIVAYFDSIGG
jgi:cellulase